VAVLGGGNTAMDAAVTAARLGVDDVYLVYRRSYGEMPAWPEEKEKLLAAGVHPLFLTQPLGYAVDGEGRLAGVRICRTELGAPDASGRRRPAAVPDSESVLAVDTAIEALGQAMPDDLSDALAALPRTEAGLLRVEADTGYTGVDNVYAGGDVVNGGTTAVQGIAEGMRAADAIDGRLA